MNYLLLSYGYMQILGLKVSEMNPFAATPYQNE